jgi:hypothetical protein
MDHRDAGIVFKMKFIQFIRFMPRTKSKSMPRLLSFDLPCLVMNYSFILTAKMPFPFPLPTTSSVLLSDVFTSTTHPSLPLQATTKRSVLKDALKKHKRLPAGSRSSHLSTVQDALNGYIPYLLCLNTASSYRDVGDERVDVELVKPLEVEWRATLSAALPGREAARPKLTGLHHELAFTFTTLAHVSSLLVGPLPTLFFMSRSIYIHSPAPQALICV